MNTYFLFCSRKQHDEEATYVFSNGKHMLSSDKDTKSLAKNVVAMGTSFELGDIVTTLSAPRFLFKGERLQYPAEVKDIEDFVSWYTVYTHEQNSLKKMRQGESSTYQKQKKNE